MDYAFFPPGAVPHREKRLQVPMIPQSASVLGLLGTLAVTLRTRIRLDIDAGQLFALLTLAATLDEALEVRPQVRHHLLTKLADFLGGAPMTDHHASGRLEQPFTSLTIRSKRPAVRINFVKLYNLFNNQGPATESINASINCCWCNRQTQWAFQVQLRRFGQCA